MKTKKINPERLSRYITSKICQTTTDKLVSLVGSLTDQQRTDIRQTLINNTHVPFNINPIYKYG